MASTAFVQRPPLREQMYDSLLAPNTLGSGQRPHQLIPFPELLNMLEHREIVAITCIDHRECNREGFLLTSAGNIPHTHLMEDLHLILKGRKALILRCHTDCAKSKAELPRIINESEQDYSERLEVHTLKRLWRDARVLLSDKVVQNALCNGLRFCAEKFDVRTGQVEYFERQSSALIEELMR